MKILLILTLFYSFNSEAVTLIKYRSTPEAESIQQFELKAKKYIFQKGSNFFDTKTEYEIGKYRIETNSETEKLEEKLSEIESKLKVADKFLRETRNLTLNELTKSDAHSSVFILGDFKINQTSKYYPVLQEIFRSLQSQEKIMISGIKLGADLSSYVLVENEKESKPQKFEMTTKCLQQALPTVCKFKDAGILYVEGK